MKTTRQTPVTLRVKCINCGHLQTIVWPVEMVPICANCELPVSAQITRTFNDSLSGAALVALNGKP